MKQLIYIVLLLINVYVSSGQNSEIQDEVDLNAAKSLILEEKFIEALNLTEAILERNSDSLVMAQCYLNLGSIESKTGKFSKAIKNYILAAGIYENRKDSLPLAQTYKEIAAISAQVSNLPKAIEYLEKSEKMVPGNNPRLKLEILRTFSAVFGDMDNTIKAIENNLEAEKIAIRLEAKDELGIIYNNLCNQFRRIKDFKTSIDFGIKGLEIKKAENLNTDVILNNIGYSYLKDKQYDRAISYFEGIMETNNGKLKSYVYNNLREAYEGKKNYEKALYFSNLQKKQNDSLTKLDLELKTSELIEKYESGKKQQQINVLNITNQLQQSKLDNQKNLFWGLGILMVLLGLLGYLWYKNQKVNQSLEKASLQHKLFQTRLNPHFLFHSLNSIQSFIYDNKKEESISYLASYSKLMRSIFESSGQDFITVREDATAMEDYLKLQGLGASENLTLKVFCEAGIEDYLIPPMFIQPYVENAIQHGIYPTTKGYVETKYEGKGDHIIVKISDNGQGIKPSKSNNKLHRSMSSEILKKRKDNLLQIYGYRIEIITHTDQEGTIITLNFPKKAKFTK